MYTNASRLKRKMSCAKVISNENYNSTSTDETCTDVKDQSIPTKVGNAISNTDTKKHYSSTLYYIYTAKISPCTLCYLSTGCVHTAPWHHYHGNKSMDGWRYCTPEEFVQFQDSSDHSERLGHFQHQMYC